MRNPLWIAAGLELNWGTDFYFDLSRQSKFFPGLLQLEEPVDAHRHNGNLQIVCQQANTCPEGEHFSVLSMMAFGKHKNAVAAIDRFAGIGEALAKSGFSRQGKQIQQRHAQSPLRTIITFSNETSGCGRSAQYLKCLASGCDCQIMS